MKSPEELKRRLRNRGIGVDDATWEAAAAAARAEGIPLAEWVRRAIRASLKRSAR